MDLPNTGFGGSDPHETIQEGSPDSSTNGPRRLHGWSKLLKGGTSSERPHNQQRDPKPRGTTWNLSAAGDVVVAAGSAVVAVGSAAAAAAVSSLVSGQPTDLASKNRDPEEEVKRMRETHLQKERGLRKKLEEKEAELEELKNVLRMYDDCSEVDIHKMVDNINRRIVELAESTAFEWCGDLSRASSGAEASTEVDNAEVDKIGSLIGFPLLNALRDSTPGEFAPVFLQFAWRASITATGEKILSSFSAGFANSGYGPPGDEVFRKVADEVMSGEAQPAYGRWRFVTHRYLRRLLSDGEEQAIQAYVDEALAHCRIVGKLAMKHCCPNDQAFTAAFQPQLRVIVEEAFKLLTTIQERMLTVNYEPYTPSNGDEFDPERMVVDKEDKTFPDDHVVCTTGLGLFYWRKEGREATSKMSPKSVFKKAQVLTEGNLNDLVASK